MKNNIDGKTRIVANPSFYYDAKKYTNEILIYGMINKGMRFFSGE